MEEESLTKALRLIVGRFGAQTPPTLLGSIMPPFETTKPNQHDNKQDFLKEKNSVLNQLESANQLFDAIYPVIAEDGPNRDLALSLEIFMDAASRKQTVNLKVDHSVDLVRKNASDVGLSLTLLYLLHDYKLGLIDRKQQLRDQEKEFWSGASRPPNHYARVIALRLARLIARETGVRPTVGTSRDGGHPSTDFSRALEEVFLLLKIKANVKRAAKWASDELTEDDLQPKERNALAGFGFPATSSTRKGLFSGVLGIDKRS